MIRKVLEEIQAIHELGSTISSVKNLEEVLQDVVDRISLLLPADRVSLIVFNRDNEQVDFFFRGGRGKDQINTSVQYSELLAGLSGWVLQQGVPARSPKNRPDPRESPEVRARRKQTRCGAILVVPLMVGRKILGTITAINTPEDRNFSHLDQQLLGLFANYCAITITNAKLVLDLKSSKEQLESAYKAKSDFLATMSHELRTPLMAVVGYSDLLLRAGLNPLQREQVRGIRLGGDVLLGLINDILDMAKMESGGLEVADEPYDLRALAASSVSMVRPGAQAKRLQLRLRIHTLVPRILIGDGRRLGQILLNLLGNGVKFTDKGSVSLEIKIEQAQQGSRLELIVTDTGPGIPQEIQPRLFQAFYQGDSSVSRRYGGTGLGLAISRSLCLLMGGEISFISDPGNGTVFKVWIPLKPGGDSRDQLRPLGPVTVQRPGLSSLVVDDVPLNRKILRAMLEHLGFSVGEAGSGEEALYLLRSQVPSVVLMDVAMPGMDGYQTSRKIRETFSAQDLPILAVTAHTQEEDRRAATQAGMDGIVFKPVVLKDLEEKLALVLNTV